MKNKNLLFLFICILLPVYSSANDIKELIRKAEQTNRATDWNKVAEYYSERRYEADQQNNYSNLFIKYAGIAIKKAAEEKSPLELGHAVSFFAESSLAFLGWDPYIENYEDALTFYADAKSIPNQIKAMSKLGNGYLAIGQHEAAHTFFQNALKHAKETPKGIVDKSILFLNLGKSYMHLNKLDSAEYYMNLSEKEATSSLTIKTTDHVAEIQLNKGLLFGKKKDFISAMAYYDGALKISDQTGKNKMLRCRILTEIALLYTTWKRYEIALSFSDRAMELCYDLEAYIPLEKIFTTHAILACMTLEQEEKAGRGATESIDLLTTGTGLLASFREWIKEDHTALYNNYIQTALLHDRYGTSDSCSYYLEKAYGLTDNTNHILPLGPYLKHTGNVYFKSGDYGPAIRFYQLYLKHYANDPRHFLLEMEEHEVHANLAKCYEKEKELERALYHRQKAYSIREEAINEENTHILASYFVKDQTFNKEAENILLKEKMQRYLIVFFIISLVIAMWLLLRRERMKRVQAENYFKGMEIEKDRIGKELHDHVASELSAITRFDAIPGATINEQFINRLSELVTHIRSISHRLSLPSFKHTTFHAVLKDFLEQRTNEEMLFQLSTNDLGYLNGLPRNYMFELYRIIQEAINNILKYANATEVSVTFHFEKGAIPFIKQKLTLTIKDNGTGFDPQQVKYGMGLKNMEERTKMLGGSSQILSESGKGTQINLYFSSFFHRMKQSRNVQA